MGKKRKPAKEDIAIDDSDDWDDEADNDDGDFIPDDELSVPPREGRQRDWRDLERYKEDRDLKRQLEDDFWADDSD